MPAIDKLPREVLSIVFDMIRNGRKRREHNRPRNLLPLMLTRKSWKDIIINNPLLWREIQLYTPDSIEATLKLARHVPLNIAYTTESFTPAVCQVVSRLTQARKIEFKHTDFQVRYFLVWAGLRPTTTLEELVLEVTEVTKEDKPVDLLANHFLGARLTRLGLRGVNISRNSPFLNSMHLKHLSLEHLNAASRLSWPETRDLLKAHPGLVTLNLTGAFSGLDEELKPREIIKMSNLKSLTVIPDTIRHLRDFFSVVRYPRVDHLKFGTLDETAQHSTIRIRDVVRHVLKACTGGDMSGRVDVLFVEFREGEGIAQAIQPYRPVIRGLGTATGFYLDIDFPYEGTRAEMVEGVLGGINLQNVTRMIGGAYLSTRVLEDYLAPLTKLKFLSLSGSLLVNKWVEIVECSGRTLFPALEKLEMRNHIRRPPTEFDEGAIKDLRSILQALRQERGTMMMLRFGNFRKVRYNKLFKPL